MGLMAVLAQDGQTEGQRWVQGELLPSSGCLELQLALACVPNRLPSIPSHSRIVDWRILRGPCIWMPQELERNQIVSFRLQSEF